MDQLAENPHSSSGYHPSLPAELSPLYKSRCKRKAPKEQLGLPNLPRELRDQIWKEVLAPDIGNHTRDSYGLHPQILRVNRQIHQEASEALYGDNCWVIFTTNYELYPRERLLARGLQYQTYMKIGAPLICLTAADAASFGGEPAMQIDIKARAIWYKKGQVKVVALMCDALRIWQCLIDTFTCPSSKFFDGYPPDNFEYTIRVDNSVQRHPQQQELMIACLKEIRGVAEASVTGLEPETLNPEITRSMMTPVQHMEEVMERYRRYRLRGDQLLALGHSIEAQMVYEDGYKRTEWQCTESLQGATAQANDDARSEAISLIARCAFAQIKIGNIKEAHDYLKSISADILGANIAVKAEIFYYQGLAFLAEGLRNKALFSFLQALLRRPGYEEVDEEIDKIEATIDRDFAGTTPSGFAYRHWLLDWNIKNVLHPLRHRSPSETKLQEQEKDGMLKAFRHDASSRCLES